MKQFIGIDVGKYQLDVCDETGSYQLPNTESDIKKLITKLKKHYKMQAFIVVFEPTGGYEKRLKKLLTTANVGLHMAHPNKVRAFAHSIGLLAKTDKLDAGLIKRYGETMQLTPDAPCTIDPEIKALIRRREQLLMTKMQEQNRLDKQYPAAITRSIKKHIKWIEKEIEAVNEQLEKQSKETLMKSDVDLLTSVPGIGSLTALYVLTYLPEIKQTNKRVIAALAGLAPYNRDSGRHQGKRSIKGGRGTLRRALYMPTLSSIRCNPDLALFYTRLRAEGKPAKVALTAVMRKLLILLSSILKRQEPWRAEYTAATK